MKFSPHFSGKYRQVQQPKDPRQAPRLAYDDNPRTTIKTLPFSCQGRKLKDERDFQRKTDVEVFRSVEGGKGKTDYDRLTSLILNPGRYTETGWGHDWVRGVWYKTGVESRYVFEETVSVTLGMSLTTFLSRVSYQTYVDPYGVTTPAYLGVESHPTCRHSGLRT